VDVRFSAARKTGVVTVAMQHRRSWSSSASSYPDRLDQPAAACAFAGALTRFGSVRFRDAEVT
jgi:hypothetical protein